MFLSLVIVGLPSGAMVAGRYVAQALGANAVVGVLAAVLVLVAAVASNLAGVKTSTRVQNAGTWALVAMATVLILTAIPGVSSGLPAVTPDFSSLGCATAGGLCWRSGRSPDSRT